MEEELIEQIVEDAIDKIWLPFTFKFIDWEDSYKKKYLNKESIN
jgi:hypothetical protein